MVFLLKTCLILQVLLEHIAEGLKLEALLALKMGKWA
jgi:hypothetical protein